MLIELLRNARWRFLAGMNLSKASVCLSHGIGRLGSTYSENKLFTTHDSLRSFTAYRRGSGYFLLVVA